MEFLQTYFKETRWRSNVPKGEFVQKLLPHGADRRCQLPAAGSGAREDPRPSQGDALDIPGRSKTLGGAEGELARLIEQRFAEAGLQPPPVSELINERSSRRPKVIEGVVGFLVKQGTLVRLAEGVYVHQDGSWRRASGWRARKGETIDVGQFKDFFGLSRKVAIPLLEWFDRGGGHEAGGGSRQVL